LIRNLQHAIASLTLMHVALLGDSTIDNVVWTGHPKEVSAQLKDLLKSSDARVSNLAADGFTSSHVLHGGVPSISLVKRQQAGDPFPELADGIFRPLDVLESLEPAPTHAVISIGGNDIRAILGCMHRLEQVVKDFQSNYNLILERVCKKVPKVVLMFQYRPSLHMDDSYGVYRAIGSLPGPGDSVAKLNRLMQNVYNPILRVAAQRQLPVVDLPRSFDIEDDFLYRCQIEPSEAGGRLIAELISHVVLHHNFGTSSKLYFKQSNCVCEETNGGTGDWSIPEQTSTQMQKHPAVRDREEPMTSTGTLAIVPQFARSFVRCFWFRS
jgi:lysophospholipase L1-like esterase